MDKEILKQQYNAQKKLIDDIRSNATIEKWKILSKAYKLGKKIWGSRFTRQRLAFDMDIPVTTTLRCLSLDRANKRTWKLIKENKISAFKVAQICQSKSITYQDEIVDLVIKNKLSTYQIKALKIRNLNDITMEKQRLACENGYSRKDSAYRSLHNWIAKGKMFLLIDRKYLPQNKLNELDKELEKLSDSIKAYRFIKLETTQIKTKIDIIEKEVLRK